MQRNGITGVLKDGERDSERRISVMEEKECHKSTAYASRGSACVMQVSRIASITQQLSYEMVLMDWPTDLRFSFEISGESFEIPCKSWWV